MSLNDTIADWAKIKVILPMQMKFSFATLKNKLMFSLSQLVSYCQVILKNILSIMNRGTIFVQEKDSLQLLMKNPCHNLLNDCKSIL